MGYKWRSYAALVGQEHESNHYFSLIPDNSDCSAPPNVLPPRFCGAVGEGAEPLVLFGSGAITADIDFHNQVVFRHSRR